MREIPLPPHPHATLEEHLRYGDEVIDVLGDQLQRLETRGVLLQFSWPQGRGYYEGHGTGYAPSFMDVEAYVCSSCSRLHARRHRFVNGQQIQEDRNLQGVWPT